MFSTDMSTSRIEACLLAVRPDGTVVLESGPWDARTRATADAAIALCGAADALGAGTHRVVRILSGTRRVVATAERSDLVVATVSAAADEPARVLDRLRDFAREMRTGEPA